MFKLSCELDQLIPSVLTADQSSLVSRLCFDSCLKSPKTTLFYEYLECTSILINSTLGAFTFAAIGLSLLDFISRLMAYDPNAPKYYAQVEGMQIQNACSPVASYGAI